MSRKKARSVPRSTTTGKSESVSLNHKLGKVSKEVAFGPHAAEPANLTVRESIFYRYGFSLFAILVFLGGVYWGAYYFPSENRGESATGEVALPLPSSSKPASYVPVEPEDYSPAAEFRKQAAILIGCQGQLHLNPELYVEIAKAVNRRLPLFGVVNSQAQAERGAALMRDSGLPPDAMRYLVLPGNTMWIRDYAPYVVRYDDDSAIVVDAKYQTREMRENRKQDELMGLELARLLGLPARSVPLLLEGGNLLSNGDGTLFTTPKTLDLNQRRDYTQKQLMGMFDDYLGVRAVYALGALQEEPNGHVDMFMSLLGKNLAVVGEIDRSEDPENSAILDKNAQQLSTITTSAGPLKVARIPMPPRWGEDWRSYTNVIMANGVLLMPSFSDVEPSLENRAEAVYRSLLPGWSIKRINCDKLVAEHGQLHCISYHLPRFVSIRGLTENAIPKVSKDGKLLTYDGAGRVKTPAAKKS